MRKFLRIFSLNLDWDEEVSQDIQFKNLAWKEQIPLLQAKAIFPDITLLIQMQLT